MSWGERSCKTQPCEIASMNGCNVDCIHYQWDGYTKPDSVSKREQRAFFEHTPFGTRLNREQRRKIKKARPALKAVS